jgi:peptidoglycan/xylan/chitin deacetylase (PgdA/CDA1 family)
MSIGADLRTTVKAWYRCRKAAVTGTSSWTVLAFHEVADRTHFAALLDLVRGAFEMVPLAEGRKRLAEQPRSARLLTITFDDADRSVFTDALPELQARAIPATVFVCTRFVQEGHRDVSTGRYPVMNWAELAEWTSAGYDVGAHTVNHIPLNQVSRDRACAEVLDSRAMLEQRLGRAVRSFAYPWGFYTPWLRAWLDEAPEFDVIATTTADDNYPNETGKHIRRRPAPAHPTAALRRGPRLVDLLRERRQRSIFTGIAPVLWRRETTDSTEL